MFNLGDLLKDRVSGLTGVAMGVTSYVYGCRRWGIAPRETKDGQPIAWAWFDEPQLDLLEPGVLAVPNAPTTGGPRFDAQFR